jgi:transposase-like protein
MSAERRFSREFKLAALARMAAGENVSALARELGITVTGILLTLRRADDSIIHGPPASPRHSRSAASRHAARQRSAQTFFGDADYALYRDLLAAFERLRRAEGIDRPLGEDSFIARLEALTRRTLKPAKRGPKPSRTDAPA